MNLLPRLIAILLGLAFALPVAAQEVRGSGSTFVAPAMMAWAKAYAQSKGVQIEYEPIGSSGGVREIRARAVDFGATDAPLRPDELLRDGLAQFPLVIGGVVPVVNLDGIKTGQLHFTGQLLADIFQGKVTNWKDPAIAALNPGAELPAKGITIIHRSDGSGTTFNWVNFLSRSSSDWKAKVGEGNSVSWPVGYGAAGNGGIADYVARAKGAIGYVEYAYPIQRKLTYGLVQNRAGNFVPPGSASFAAAAAGADWASVRDFALLLNDSAAADAYPIVGTSFAVMYKIPQDAARSRETLSFFKWALNNGQDLARQLGYKPLPPALVQLIEAYCQAQIRQE